MKRKTVILLAAVISLFLAVILGPHHCDYYYSNMCYTHNKITGEDVNIREITQYLRYIAMILYVVQLASADRYGKRPHDIFIAIQGTFLLFYWLLYRIDGDLLVSAILLTATYILMVAYALLYGDQKK
jgi:hypothetical protein